MTTLPVYRRISQTVWPTAHHPRSCDWAIVRRVHELRGYRLPSPRLQRCDRILQRSPRNTSLRLSVVLPLGLRG